MDNALEVICETIVFFYKVLFILAKTFIRNFITTPETPVDDDVILITGGAKGIGRELATIYAEKNAKTVVIWDVDEEGGKDTVSKIRESNANVFFYKVDVSNREEVQKAAKILQENHGDVTILINNAGIMPVREVLDRTEDTVQKTIGINLQSHFWTIEAFLPQMKANKRGHIVAISSTLGLASARNLCVYSSTKFAIRGLMMGLKAELRASGLSKSIKTTCIYPYGVSTGLVGSRFRFFSLTKFQTPQEAATNVIQAQQRALDNVSLPKFWYYMLLVLELMPIEVTFQLQKFLKYEFYEV